MSCKKIEFYCLNAPTYTKYIDRSNNYIKIDKNIIYAKFNKFSGKCMIYEERCEACIMRKNKNVISHNSDRRYGCNIYHLDYKLHYINGKINGEAVWYFKNGKIAGKHSFIKDIKNGAYILYHNNRNIEYKYYYIDGKKNGEYISRFKNGSLKDKLYYINNKINGYKNHYLKNDIMYCKYYYIDNKSIDFIVRYDKTTASDIRYKNIYNKNMYT